MSAGPLFVFTQLPPERRARVAAGLRLLSEAFEDAAGAEDDVWQFAMRLGEMYAAGLTSTDVRWLISRRFVRHALERLPIAARRTFAHSESLDLPGEVSLVLHTEVAAAVRSWLPAAGKPATERLPRAPCPQWNQNQRELRVNDAVVKRYRVPARSQEIILASFEEDNWPERIDDPLPVSPDVDPAQRLHDAVRGLNRNQRRPLIRFERDGRGKGVCWYLQPEPDPD